MANIEENEFTKLTPFFVNTGGDPQTRVDLSPPKRGDIDTIEAHTVVTRISEIPEFTRTAMTDAQKCSHEQAGTHRHSNDQATRAGSSPSTPARHAH